MATTRSATEPDPVRSVWRYRVYGLRLEADAPIDGLTPISGEHALADVRVTLGALPTGVRGQHDPPLLEDDNVVFRRAGEGFSFEYRDGTRFIVGYRGRDIWAVWPPTSTAADTATYLLGPVLAFVLRSRGTLSLHASAVEIAGRAVAFAAWPGGGKSTTASWFADRGYRVLTDDVMPIAFEGGKPYALSGYPRIRLWPDTVQARYGAPDALPLLTPTWNKRYLDVSATFSPDPLPVGSIVVLGDRKPGAPHIERIDGHQAAMKLVVNTSMALYLDADMRARELDHIVDLARGVPVFAASASSDMARLDELCEQILALGSPR